MAAELVNAATNEKLTEMDWTKSIETCELVARDHRQARDVVKAIKKRVVSKNPNTQLFSVMLLEVLMNNIGEPIHTQVIDTGLLPVLVKLVKKKSDLPAREKIFLLLDATQTSLGGASGRFPQYYSAYYDLVSAGVQFSPRSEPRSETRSVPPPKDPPTSNISRNGSANGSAHERDAPQTERRIAPESSIIQKAGAALEVLREVLAAVDADHPEGAKDEFTLDLVEQCSFHKQRIMHLAIHSRDEKVISQAVELNEQLEKALGRHDAIVSGRPTTIARQLEQEELEEEEEPEQLFRRIRKGKACVRAEDEDSQVGRPPMGLLGSAERLHRPLIRPITIEPKQEAEAARPPPTTAAASIPPPPAKHIEREKFFKENKDVSSLAGHTRGLSLHSRNASSSGSIDYSD